MRILTGLALVLLGLTLPASAIELSLEQNKAERGSIGFIDMQRLFQEFPETIQAKEDFKGLVQQAEEQLNLKKTEVLRLRNDLAQLRQQRDSLANAPVPAQAPIPAAVKPENPAASKPAPQTALRTEPQPTPKPPAPVASPIAAPPPAPAKPASLAIAPQTQEVETDLTRPLLADMPGFAVTAAPTTAAPSQPVQTAPVAVQPAAPKPPPPPRSVAISTAPAPAAAPAAMPPSGPTPAQLDAEITQKTGELAAKEAELQLAQEDTEKNLLDIEKRKTDMLLGKIHDAVQEVAESEGISVVVDKSSILFGHDAVDLTEKVLKRLKESR